MKRNIIEMFKGKGEGPRNLVICTTMPDGENYFQGVHEVQLPLKGGGYMPIMTNLWTIHFADLKAHTGIFTRKEADFYLEIIAMDGVFIRTWAEETARREKDKN